MSQWMKVAVVALAAVAAFVPTFAQVSYAQAVPEPVPVLPFGEELSDEELLGTEGEFWHWVVAIACGVAHAIGWTIYDAFFDGQPGFQRTNEIIGGSLLVYCGVFIAGAQISTMWTVAKWLLGG